MVVDGTSKFCTEKCTATCESRGTLLSKKLFHLIKNFVMPHSANFQANGTLMSKFINHFLILFLILFLNLYLIEILATEFK